MTAWFVLGGVGLAGIVRLAGGRRAWKGVLLLVVGVWGIAWLTRPGWLGPALDLGAEPKVGVMWTERAPGLETGELSVVVDGEEVDDVALVRVDPARWQFSVHHGVAQTVETWQRELGAAVVINGSYFGTGGIPSTPIRAGGVGMGPQGYVSQHGAFVAEPGADVIALHGQAVGAIASYREAIVSYPMLMEGAVGKADWLANRSFVGVDVQGRIVMGTTRTAYCSLPRLGSILRRARLDLRAALNLDGGPSASQVVSVGDFRRAVHGIAETSSGADVVRILYERFLRRSWELPTVLAVTPR